MLGFAPLAAAPLGAAGSGAVAYDVSFSDAAVVADIALQAFPIYLSVLTEDATGTDAIQVTASTFTANLSGAATGDDAVSAVPTYLANLSDAADGVDSAAAIGSFLSNIIDGAFSLDSVLVEASEFGANVSDTAAVNGTPDAAADFDAAFSDEATIDDANAADYLWKIINDSQGTSWSVVKTQA
jgi:predicted 3-demethylubiquinone-9 3-methyltransferase (glyoxalase superfamily)